MTNLNGDERSGMHGKMSGYTGLMIKINTIEYIILTVRGNERKCRKTHMIFLKTNSV